jgi:hypothetical protein
VDAELECRLHIRAADRNRGARSRRDIPVRSRERRSLCVRQQPFAIHRDPVASAQIADPARVGSARRDGGEPDRLEHALHEWQGVRVRRELGHRAGEHLFGASAGGNQSYTHLDEPDVGLCRGLHTIRMQHDFAATAERHASRADDDRDIGVLQRHRGLLKPPNHEIHFVPVALLRLEQ